MTDNYETTSISWERGELTAEGRDSLSQVVKATLHECGVSASQAPDLFRALHERFYALLEEFSSEVYAVASEPCPQESSLFVDIFDFIFDGALHEWAIKRKHRELGLVEHKLRILRGGTGNEK